MEINGRPVELVLADACARCPGFCCYRFVTPDWRKYDPSSLSGDTLKDFEYIKANFKFVRKVRGMSSIWCTCTKHDIVTGRCTDYENRPKLCRRYHCVLNMDPRKLFVQRNVVMRDARAEALKDPETRKRYEAMNSIAKAVTDTELRAAVETLEAKTKELTVQPKENPCQTTTKDL